MMSISTMTVTCSEQVRRWEEDRHGMLQLGGGGVVRRWGIIMGGSIASVSPHLCRGKSSMPLNRCGGNVARRTVWRKTIAQALCVEPPAASMSVSSIRKTDETNALARKNAAI